MQNRPWEIAEDRYKECFENKSFIFNQSEQAIFRNYILSKVESKWGSDFQLKEDVTEGVIQAVAKALKTYDKPPSITYTHAIASVISYHLPKVFSTVLENNGRPLSTPFGLTVIEERSTAENPRSGGCDIKVSRVDKDTDAQRAGIQPGDIIDRIDGVRARSKRQTIDLLKDHGSGRIFPITIKRGPETIQVNLQLTVSEEIGEVSMSEGASEIEATVVATDEAKLNKMAAEWAFNHIGNQNARRVLEMKLIDGKSYQQILDSDRSAFRSINNVKQLRGRGLKEFFENLEKYADSRLAASADSPLKDLIRVYRQMKQEAIECKREFDKY